MLLINYQILVVENMEFNMNMGMGKGMGLEKIKGMGNIMSSIPCKLEIIYVLAALV